MNSGEPPAVNSERRLVAANGRIRAILAWLAAAGLGFVVVIVPLEQLALVSGAILVLASALAHPVLAVCLVVLSVPVQELVTLPAGLTSTQAATLLACFSWLLHTLAHPERAMLPGGILPLWGTFLCALLLSAGLTPYARAEAIRETLRWSVAAIIWLIAAGTATRRWHMICLLACLLLAPAVCAAIGVVQFATGDGPPAFRIAPNLPYVRAYGTIGQPNSFAGYMNMAWPLGLALAMVATRFAWRRPAAPTLHPLLHIGGRWLLTGLLWAATALLLAALLASFSRGAWLGALAGALGLALALERRVWRALLMMAVVAMIMLLLAAAGLLPGALAARLASMAHSLTFFDAATAHVTPENFAVVERMAQMQAGWAMFLAAPLTGIGPGNYAVAYPEFAVGAWYSGRGHAHNYYLHLAAETGIIGLLAYLGLIGGLIRQTMIALRCTTDPFLRSVVAGSCGIITAVAGHNLFENLHVLNMGMQLATIWAVLHIIARSAANPRGPSCGI